MTLKELKEALGKSLHQAKAVAEKAEAENRDFTAEERAQVKGFMEEAKGFKVKIDEAQGDSELRDQLKSLGEGIDLLPNDPEAPTTGPGKGKSLGERFVGADKFKNWMDLIAPNGEVSDQAKGLISPAVQFKGLKDLITGGSDTSAGALVAPDVRPLVGLPSRPLTMRDIVTVGQTTSDLIRYPQEVLRTNNAAPVAEAIATAGASGEKPESAFTLELAEAAVKTIAHWIPATKRALSDAAQIRTLIDNFLETGLEEELEDQMIQGNGAGENFLGIANVGGTQAQAWDTDIFVTTRKARTKVLTPGRARPTAYLLNPLDWERFDLERDLEGRFHAGGPFADGQQRLWRVPVVESEAVPVGVGYAGDFRTCVLYDREQASVQISDSHDRFFIRNMIAILAELRAAFAVHRPAAIVEIDLTEL